MKKIGPGRVDQEPMPQALPGSGQSPPDLRHEKKRKETSKALQGVLMGLLDALQLVRCLARTGGDHAVLEGDHVLAARVDLPQALPGFEVSPQALPGFQVLAEALPGVLMWRLRNPIALLWL